MLLMSPLVRGNICGQQQGEKPHRVIVLTDMEADPDDAQSLVRLLLYTNEIDVQGIVATTSVHQRAKVAPETVHRIIDAYGEVQPNLLQHGIPIFPQTYNKSSIVP